MAKTKREGAKFRHKCSNTVNPKFDADGERNEEYSSNIRKEYEVPKDSVWHALFAADPQEVRLGLAVATGRIVAFVSCPDCGEQVTVVTEA